MKKSGAYEQTVQIPLSSKSVEVAWKTEDSRTVLFEVQHEPDDPARMVQVWVGREAAKVAFHSLTEALSSAIVLLRRRALPTSTLRFGSLAGVSLAFSGGPDGGGHLGLEVDHVPSLISGRISLAEDGWMPTIVFATEKEQWPTEFEIPPLIEALWAASSRLDRESSFADTTTLLQTVELVGGTWLGPESKLEIRDDGTFTLEDASLQGHARGYWRVVPSAGWVSFDRWPVLEDIELEISAPESPATWRGTIDGDSLTLAKDGDQAIRLGRMLEL